MDASDLGPDPMDMSDRSDGGPPDRGPDGGPDGGLDAGEMDASAPLEFFALTCDRNLEPTPHGGGAGGPVDEDVHVFAVFRDRPVRDATVVIQARGGSAEATTNARGCVRFFAEDLAPPYDVHVFDDDRAWASFLSQSAAQLTVDVGPRFGESPGVAAQTEVSGRVTNLPVVGAITSTVSRFGVVRPLSDHAYVQQAPPRRRPESEFFESQVVDDGDETELLDFVVRPFRHGSEGLFVEAGRLIQGPYERSRFVPTHVGVRTGLDFAQTRLTDQDLSLTAPITVDADLELSPAPAGLPVRRVFGLVQVPTGGEFSYGLATEDNGRLRGNRARFPMPRMQGALSTGTYGAIGIFETEPDAEALLQSVVIDRGRSSARFAVSSPWLPWEGPSSSEGGLSLETNPDADWLELTVATGRTAVWRVFAHDAGALDRIPLPPAPGGVSSRLNGEVEVASRWTQLGTGYDPSNFSRIGAGRHWVRQLTRFSDSITFDDPDPNPFACPADGPVALQYGGVAGGTPNGSVVIHTVDTDTQLPVEFVPFVVAVGSGVPLASGITDRNGCARVPDPSLTGPWSLHLFPESGPYQSFFGVRGARLTALVPDERASTEDPPFTAVVQGTLRDFDVLAADEPGEVAIIRTAPLERNTLIPNPRQPTRDDLNFFESSGVVSSGFGWDLREYSLRVTADAALGVVSFGGVLDTNLDEITTTHVGITTGIQPSAGDVLTGVDGSSLVPLDQTLEVSLQRAPSFEEPEQLVLPLLVMPGGGMTTLAGSEAVSDSLELTVPDRIGPLSDVRYGAYAYREAGSEFALVIEEGGPDTNLDVELPRLPFDVERDGRRFFAKLPVELRDRARVFLFVPSGAGFAQRWTIDLHDPGAGVAFLLPEVPAGRTDPLRQSVVLLVDGEGFTPGFDWSEAPGHSALAARRRWARTLTDELAP
jgi:hypothetical protein